MTTAEFKTEIKKISGQLKGLTLQFANRYSVTPYTSLKAFGLAVLNAEAEGLNVQLKKVWTATGLVPVNSFSELTEMLKAGIVTGIRVEAMTPVAGSFNQYVYDFGSLD